MKRAEKIYAYLLFLPAFAFIAFLRIYPVFSGIWLSLTNQGLASKKSSFIGLANLTRVLFNDSQFWSIMGYTFYYTFGTVVLSYILGLIVALLVNNEIKGKMLFRALVLIPWVVPPVVAAVAWLWTLNDQTGVVNILLRNLGVVDKPIQFFSRAQIAQNTVTVLGGWKAYPFMMLILLAGMQNIPDELYESARIDGANAWQCFRKITMPMLKGVTLVSTTLMTIWTFNGFENIYLLTEGGPANSTYVVSIYSYNVAFTRNRLGYASAISTILLVLMLIMTIVYMRIINKNND